MRQAVVVATQHLTWWVGQLFRLRLRLRLVYPHGPLPPRHGKPLILAPTHELVLDPWIAVSTFDYRTWRDLAPVHILGTRSWNDWLRWFAWLWRALYRLYGVVELPPRSENAGTEEKLRGLVDALGRGDVVAIFPEGHVREEGEPAVRPFKQGVVLLHRASGAQVVPMAIVLDPEGRRGWRRTFVLVVGRPVTVPEELGAEEAAAWLRQRSVALHETVRPGPDGDRAG